MDYFSNKFSGGKFQSTPFKSSYSSSGNRMAGDALLSQYSAPQAAKSYQNIDAASAGAQYGMTDPRTKALTKYQEDNKKDTAAAPTWSPK